MSYEIVKYKIFKDSESFEKFQLDNPVKIIAVAPMADSADINDGSVSEIKVQVFVTYFDNKEGK